MKKLIVLISLFLLGLPLVRGPHPWSETHYESVALAPQTHIANDYPIILVPGFMGMDRNTFEHFFYWGGTVDLEQELRRAGHEVYTASIGPISSNWDRACELFASIRGGTVDYGAAHAAEHGHARYGQTFEGLYPEWGTIDPHTGTLRKVHLVAHSMGGQTARLLTHLLHAGDAAEQRAAGAEELSRLFKGGHNWVASVTTLATPHDGTTLTAKYKAVGDLVKLLARWVATDSVTRPEPVWDLHLDHWESAAAAAGLSLEEYISHMIDEDHWREMQDFAWYDLTPEGSRKLNRRVQAHPDVYYFSFATSTTSLNTSGRKHTPIMGTSLPLMAGARFMGAYTTTASSRYTSASTSAASGSVPIDGTWLENDGMVNTVSMDGPKLGSEDRIVPFNGTPQPGVWNFMGLLKPCDHWDIQRNITLLTSPPPGYDSLLDFYLKLAGLLRSLEER